MQIKCKVTYNQKYHKSDTEILKNRKLIYKIAINKDFLS